LDGVNLDRRYSLSVRAWKADKVSFM
jgi:hypothetical protein